MQPVERDSILDFVTYEEQRDTIRPSILAEKAKRRIHVGGVLTFLFENRQTVRYQVQEMMRIERIVKEADILHELATYNEVLGGEGELGCTLLIEIDDEAERSEKLSAWMELPWHVYDRMENGEKAYARFDERQVGDQRLSSVHYLKFDVQGSAPVAIGVDLEGHLVAETELNETQLAALAADLA